MCKPSRHHPSKAKPCGTFRLTHLLLGALLVMVLWNAIVPELFGGPPLGYWQALGLLALSRLLIGGVSYSVSSGHSTPSQGRWREAFEAKMQAHCEQKRKEQNTDAPQQEDDAQFREGFTGKRWDVYVIDVEEGDDDAPDSPAQDSDDSDTPPSNRPSDQ